MSHTYTSIYIHCTFSTKRRLPTIRPGLRDRLWAYIGATAAHNGMKALTVGGTADHCHALISIPPTLSVARALQLLKGSSSRWVHDTFVNLGDFGWQEGYGAFSIGVSQVEDTIRYIRNQEEHHRRMSFEEEFERFLRKHGLPYERDQLFD